MRDKISNDLRLRIKLGNISRKSQSRWEADSGAQSLFQKKDFDHSSKKIRTNWYQFFLPFQCFLVLSFLYLVPLIFFRDCVFSCPCNLLGLLQKSFLLNPVTICYNFFNQHLTSKAKKNTLLKEGKEKN